MEDGRQLLIFEYNQEKKKSAFVTAQALFPDLLTSEENVNKQDKIKYRQPQELILDDNDDMHLK